MALPLVQIAPEPVLQFTDDSGNLLSGGLLFTYAAGTTGKLTTYTDSTGATPNTNPIVLDARGECSVWCTPGLAYKFVLSPSTDTDPPTNQFWTSDNLTPGSYLYEVIAQSTSSMTIATGSVTFNVTPYTNFQIGQNVTIVYPTVVTDWMYGTITAYVPASGSITVNVASTGGSGTYSSWNVSLGGSPAIMAAVAQYASTASSAATTISNNITNINTLANDITQINSLNATQINSLNTTQIAVLSTITVLAEMTTVINNLSAIQSAPTNAANAASSATAAAASATSAAASAAALPNGPSIGTGNIPEWNGSAWVGVNPSAGGNVSNSGTSTTGHIVQFADASGKNITDTGIGIGGTTGLAQLSGGFLQTTQIAPITSSQIVSISSAQVIGLSSAGITLAQLQAALYQF